jgi:hypothetical protein
MPTRSARASVYLQHINAIIGHVRENLNDDLSMDMLAWVAGFPTFHIHRVPNSLNGETFADQVAHGDAPARWNNLGRRDHQGEGPAVKDFLDNFELVEAGLGLEAGWRRRPF